MKRKYLMVIAIIGNAFGTALMANTNLGLSVWGSVAFGVKEFYGIGLGSAFLGLSVLFYIVAVILYKNFNLKACLESFAFAIGFGTFTDFFVKVLPDLSQSSLLLRTSTNFLGLAILMFAIACHLKVNRAVHPMDVFLDSVQKKLNSVMKGSYVAYFSAFILTIIFSLLNHKISGVGFGTLMTLLVAGLMLDYYDKKILRKIM